MVIVKEVQIKQPMTIINSNIWKQLISPKYKISLAKNLLMTEMEDQEVQLIQVKKWIHHRKNQVKIL